MLTTLMYTSSRTLSLLVNYLPVVFYTLHTCAMCGPWTQPAASFMGACRGARGALAPPLEFEKMTSYTKYPKFFARAFGACYRYMYSIFQSKTAQKTQKFSFAPPAHRKMVNFLYGAPKTCHLFKVSLVLPPSGKISAGAHGFVEPLLLRLPLAPRCQVVHAFQQQRLHSSRRLFSSFAQKTSRAHHKA